MESISGNRSQDWSADYFLDKHKLRSTDRFPSPPRCVIQSCVDSRSSALNCLRKSFFLFCTPYSLFTACSSLVSTHTNSEPPTSSLELRLWCQQQRELQEVVTRSPLVRLTRQRRQTGGQHRPRVDIWSKYKFCFFVFFTKCYKIKPWKPGVLRCSFKMISIINGDHKPFTF